jgi:hypothetical protein
VLRSGIDIDDDSVNCEQRQGAAEESRWVVITGTVMIAKTSCELDSKN